MNQDKIVATANAQNQFKHLLSVNEVFLESIKNSENSNNFLHPISVSIGFLSTTSFGYELRATPRPVRSPSGDFFMEYVFQSNHDEEKVSVWSFYLSRDGELKESLDSSARKICDFNSEQLGEQLLKHINYATLNSALLNPVRG